MRIAFLTAPEGVEQIELTLVTSRRPDDLKAFREVLLTEFARTPETTPQRSPKTA